MNDDHPMFNCQLCSKGFTLAGRLEVRLVNICDGCASQPEPALNGIREMIKKLIAERDASNRREAAIRTAAETVVKLWGDDNCAVLDAAVQRLRDVLQQEPPPARRTIAADEYLRDPSSAIEIARRDGDVEILNSDGSLYGIVQAGQGPNIIARTVRTVGGVTETALHLSEEARKALTLERPLPKGTTR